MTKYIYARVSTEEQNADQQSAYLAEKYPHDLAVQEKFTGTTTDRPKFKELLSRLKRGDTLIVKEVSRIGRNTQEVLAVTEELKAAGVHLVIDQLGGMDVTSPAGEMILTVMAGLAKMEREQLRERQLIGIERAKAEGKYKGRKPVDPATIRTAKLLIEQGQSKESVAKQLKIGVSTLYKYLASEETD
ncbi:recombinase family protein [Microbulbifer aggregans]|uniref:recombinase family protein n=1 Tax=Microbulbifer aggregans TaxID=1769779 RepID=UPI001CFEAB67|nr:recombinase family protein [Microbulbifer aggregans]